MSKFAHIILSHCGGIILLRFLSRNFLQCMVISMQAESSLGSCIPTSEIKLVNPNNLNLTLPYTMHSAFLLYLELNMEQKIIFPRIFWMSFLILLSGVMNMNA